MNTDKKHLDHATLSEKFNRDEERVNWHDKTLWFIREKRDRAARQVDGWETLRNEASAIKQNVLSNLAEYLEQFEGQALANGVHVHWAFNAEEHNRIVHDIIGKKGIRKIVKSKSMLTEECHLNEYLERKGIEVIDTDL